MKSGRTPDIVVVGASAGGVSALQQLVAGLPAGLEAAVFIVLHTLAESESFLPHILTRSGELPACHAVDGEPFEMGRVYVAPPDHHLTVLEDGRMGVTRGPKENRHRPSIDVLFRSAAAAYGNRVVGVLLSGSDDDGAAGMQAIVRGGGIAVVQDPDDSAYPEMPQSALRLLDPDYTLPVAGIGALLARLSEGSERPKERRPVEQPVGNPGREEGLPADAADPRVLGVPSAFTCPECSGTLWELRDGDLLRFRCRVGHAYSEGSMIEAQSETVERALWEAVRVLEESASMSRRIAQRTSTLRHSMTQKAEERERHAQIIRDVLLGNGAGSG